MEKQKNASWLARVEDIITVLEGSSVSELELTEEGTQITIRRRPNMVMTAAPTVIATPGQVVKAAKPGASSKVDKSIPIPAPLTGVYYSAASPTTPAFVNIGDVVHVGQVVALIEAMKVFNEITAETSGRVVSLDAKNGDVVQKGSALLRVEPL